MSSRTQSVWTSNMRVDCEWVWDHPLSALLSSCCHLFTPRYKSPSCLLCASSYTPDSPLEVSPKHSGFIQHHRRWFAHSTQCSQLPCGATQGIYHNYTKTQNFTHFITPTPRIPILRDFWPEPLKFERDFCIGYPHFRWTPLPEAIPSRRNDPDFCPKQTIFHATAPTIQYPP